MCKNTFFSGKDIQQSDLQLENGNEKKINKKIIFLCFAFGKNISLRFEICKQNKYKKLTIILKKANLLIHVNKRL